MYSHKKSSTRQAMKLFGPALTWAAADLFCQTMKSVMSLPGRCAAKGETEKPKKTSHSQKPANREFSTCMPPSNRRNRPRMCERSLFDLRCESPVFVASACIRAITASMLLVVDRLMLTSDSARRHCGWFQEAAQVSIGAVCGPGTGHFTCLVLVAVTKLQMAETQTHNGRK